MPILSRFSLRAAAAALMLCALASSGAAMLIRSRPARAASVGALRHRISAASGQASALASDVAADSRRLDALHGSVAALETEIGSLQADLTVKRRGLTALQAKLTAARARLTRVQSAEARDEALLSRLLVSQYESGRPDLVSVVLNATGFQDLLERVSFQQRIRDADVAMIGQVRAARRQVARQATQLGALEVRQQALVAAVARETGQLMATRVALVREQISVAQSRRQTAGRLTAARQQVAGLQRQLSSLQAAQAAATRAAAAKAPGGATAGGRAGGFAFPLPLDAVIGPGGWTPDDGVDMAAPADAPEFAVCSGTIVLHGIGGFGPWAPVLHCDHSLDGYSYVYYGHAGPLYQLPVGTHVSEGQVMSSIGPGIVGFSTGPHIEIGFADAGGDPIGPSSAGTMMALLHSAY